MARKGRRQTNYFVAGTTNSRDDVTGFKEKFSDLRRRWDGIYTTDLNWEKRQPQDFPPHIEKQKVEPYARPPIVEVEEFPPIEPI